jgi:PKD repeat protein
VTYTFDISGTQQIGVLVENRAGSVSSTRSISVTVETDPEPEPEDKQLYLPLITR